MKLYVLTGIALYCLVLCPTEARCEDIVKTTVCEVVANPPAFDHKLIELTGYATEGMENFSLSTKDCLCTLLVIQQVVSVEAPTRQTTPGRKATRSPALNDHPQSSPHRKLPNLLVTVRKLQ